MSKQPPVAIVGVSALFPGSSDATGFWRDILSGKDLMEEVPPSHWLLEDYHSPDPDEPDKTYARRGAFLGDVDFSPMDYGIPPNILAATDTGQLLAMIVARQLLEDAYDAPFEEVDSSRVGVVLGVASTTELCLHMAGRLQQPMWEEGMRRSGLSKEEIDRVSEKITDMYVPWQESTFPGLLGNVVSGRIANRFDLGGTNCVVDAACASSLAAVEMGINQLTLGQADMMITGGVDALNDILMYMCFSQTGALSQTGDCRPFSSSADGTMMAEGLGMFALKRLEDAEEAGDQIYAVIRGVGSSSDGRAKSIYAPRPEGQSLALERAYEEAGYTPDTVEMIEAHGTATPAGDAAETRGLKAVFGDGEDADRQSCALGSVKSQIGHAKAAAGAAGLFKNVMSLNDRVLPPTIKIDEPNHDLGLDESPFYLNTEPRPWIRGGDHRRRNAVSAFGFGGTNFHVTLEEYTGEDGRAPRRRTLGSELVVLSADDPGALVDRCRELADEAQKEGMLSFLAQTTQHEFDAEQPARIAIVADDEQQLADRLQQAADTVESNPDDEFSAPGGIHYANGTEPGDVAFLFPGQGSQYLNMGNRWAMHFDDARNIWDESTELNFDDEFRLDEVVFPPPVFDEETKNEQKERLTATEWAQPALGATSLSALRLLENAGITPSFSAGHSYGEITALAAAGVFDAETMLRISRKRGELMADASSTPGAMTAVKADADDLADRLDEWNADVVIANHNSPTQCVLSGSVDAIERVEQNLDDESISFTRLDVDTAFHSSLVSDSAVPFEEFLNDVKFDEADFPVYANTTATAYPDDADEMRQLLAEQLANPVRFVDQIRAMYDAGARTFVEVGPRSTLTRLVGKCLGDEPHHRIHLDRRKKSGVESLWNALGFLATRGLDVDFTAFWEEYEEIDDPRKEEDDGFTVAINGTNYDKPYPGDEPRPEPDAPPTPAGNSRRIEDTDTTDKPNRPQVAMSNEDDQPTQSSSRSRPSRNDGRQAQKQAPAKNGRADTPAWQQSPASAGDATWVDAFREQQRRTAEAHETFQETTAEAHRAFLETMNSSFRALGQIATGESAEPPALPRESGTPLEGEDGWTNGRAKSSADARKAGRVPDARKAARAPDARTASRAPTSSRAGRTTQPRSTGEPQARPPQETRRSTSTTETTHTNGRTAPARPATDTGTQTQTTTSAPSTTEQKTKAAGPDDDVDVLDLLMATVADKTGYPSEMLEADMELEADLGVDSIKQVEIMSEIEEAIPSLPDVEANELANLDSIRAIADYLEELSGGSAVAEAGGAPAEAPEPDTGSDLDLKSVLVDVVADKTGYPSEMLQPEMELEADLGVDSIKQVEIMSEMEERFPQLPDVEANELAELDSLDDIGGYLEGLIGGREPRSSSSNKTTTEEDSDDDSEEDQGPADGIKRYVVRPVDTPACGWAMRGVFDLERIDVVSADEEMAKAVADALNDRGVDAEPTGEFPDDCVAAVYLDALCPPDDLEDAAAINRKAILGARDMAQNGDPKLFVTAQNTGGDFRAASDFPERSWTAGVGALAKTASAEWPDCAVKSIDVDTSERNLGELASCIAEEIVGGGPELEVGFPDGERRVTPVAHTEHVERAEPTGELTGGSVVVVSGGAKGVTARSIIELAQNVDLRFVLLGRTELVDEPEKTRGITDDAELNKILLEQAKAEGSSLTPKELQSRTKHIKSCREIRDTLRQLEEAGSEARYASCDVRDTDRIREILDDVRSDWGPVEGVIHGAGVLADALIADKTADQFDFVFNTKIEGAKALLDATEDDPLKLLCLFSSVAARSGNPGQSDYAMANEVLNKIAHAEAKQRDGCRVKSLGWGPWDGGMVTPELKALFEKEGVVLLPKDTGADMLVDEVLYAPTGDVELVLGGSVSAEGVNGSQLGRGVFCEFDVDATSHPYLDGHRLRGTPVVPAMLVVDWFTRFAEAACPDLVVGRLRDVEVRNGIKLENFDDGGDRLKIRARTTEGADGQWPTLGLILEGEDGTVHYTAVAEMAPERQAPTDELVDGYDFDVEPSSVAVDDAYEEGRLFHGDEFEVLTDIEGIDDGGGIARLDGLRRMDWPDESWVSDPAAMDGALQIGLLWGLHLIDAQTLPMRTAEFTPFADAPSDEPLVCRVRSVDYTKRKIVADVLITTEGGEPLCELRGVEMYAVPDGV